MLVLLLSVQNNKNAEIRIVAQPAQLAHYLLQKQSNLCMVISRN